MKSFEGDNEARRILAQSRPLPQDARAERVVLWKAFRNEDQALEYSRHILLEDGQRVVGGCGEDDMGWYCWLGVEVDDIEAWGNSQAIQLVDPLEADDPQGQGRNL